MYIRTQQTLVVGVSVGNDNHIQAYKNNKKLNSKSKEKYRLKLMKKEKMLKESGCKYLILFRPDMTIENFESILLEYSVFEKP